MYSSTGPVKAATDANQHEKFLYPLSLNTLLLIYLFLWVIVFKFHVMNLVIWLTCSAAFACQNKFCYCFLHNRNRLRSICCLVERGCCVSAGCVFSSCLRVIWLSRSWLSSSGWICWATIHTSKWVVSSGCVCVLVTLLPQEISQRVASQTVITRQRLCESVGRPWKKSATASLLHTILCVYCWWWCSWLQRGT